MKTDRELLELAAKAAGLQYIKPLPEYSGSLGLEVGSNPMRTQTWNPLTDDGDALRLAVKLKLLIDGCSNCVQTMEQDHGWFYGDSGDNCTKTRRAIVLAAAAIGEQA